MYSERIKALAKFLFEIRFTNLSWEKMPEIHGFWIQKILNLTDAERNCFNNSYMGYQDSEIMADRVQFKTDAISFVQRMVE